MALLRWAPTRIAWLAGVLAVVLLAAAPVAKRVGANEGEIQAARAEANTAADAFTAAETRLDDTEVAIGRAQQTIEQTRVAYEELRGVAAEELLNEYVRSGSSQLPFGESDINTRARASALSRAARGETRSRGDELSVAKAALDRQLVLLNQQRADANRQRDELAAQRDALYERLRELVVLEGQRQESERQADQQRRQAEAAAAQAAYDGAVRAAELAAQERAGAGGPGGSGNSGGSDGREADLPPPPPRPAVPVDWLCPITGGYSFSDTWGAARSGGRSHRGTDMFADYGTAVVAVVDGEAVDYGWDGAGGNGVFLLGDDGNRYYYAHLDDFGSLGRVSQGDVVGYVGDTGNAGGTPHLHFEIHPGGSGWTNPYSSLTQYC